MSAKYRNLRMELERLGCEARQGKGSHVIYTHSDQPARQVTLCGNDGQEAPKYQVMRVRAASPKNGSTGAGTGISPATNTKEEEKMKNRELRALLRQLGFQFRQHGGSHQIWTHPVQHRCRVTLCGHDGDDAPKYQEARVKKFVKGIMKHDDTRCNKIEVA